MASKCMGLAWQLPLVDFQKKNTDLELMEEKKLKVWMILIFAKPSLHRSMGCQVNDRNDSRWVMCVLRNPDGPDDNIAPERFFSVAKKPESW